MKGYIARLLSLSVLLCVGAATSLHADQALRPYVLASTTAGDMAAKVEQVKSALQDAGFEVAGAYSPYDGAHVIVVTSDQLNKAAAATDFGGFGAGQRVSVTQVGDQLQVAYMNPTYIAGAYRMQSDLMKPVEDKLAAALGREQDFGSDKGLTEKKLRKYRYMFAMPHFDDLDKLNTFDSYEAAITHIETALSAKTAGASKVYRIDIPGKKETVFGIAMTRGESNDEKVMSVVDVRDRKHTAHLPYELLVSGNTAYALRGRFRIAVNFPDLTMGTFTKIMSTPGDIKRVLTELAGGK